MNSLKDKRVLIFQQRNWGKLIGRFLAQKLTEEGCHLAALTFKRSTDELIHRQPGVKYDLIIANDEIMSEPKKFLAEDDFSLEEICEALGVDSIWPLAQTLRNHVKSYREKYYYAFRQNVSDEGIEDYIKAVYKYIKIFFNEFKPDAILTPNFVSLPHIMFNLYAEKQSVPMFGITDSKVRGIYLFTYGYRDDHGPFWSRVDELNAGADTLNRERAKKYIVEFRKVFKSPDYMKEKQKESLIKKLRYEIAPYWYSLKWLWNKPIDYVKSTGITIDYRPPRYILRDHYSQKRYKKFADAYHYYPFEEIGKFIYFPLQFQPESTIDVVAPFTSNQIETARQVSMSMPGDYTLVVKEHPAMVGLRPPSYLEKIARTANVKLIDYRIPNKEVLEKSDLIISPNGTTLAEAAFFRKKCIQLGELGTTLKLPNVFKHSDMSSLSAKIKEVLEIELNETEYEKRLENFVAAAYDVGIEADYLRIWEKGDLVEREKLWPAYKKELDRVLIK